MRNGAGDIGATHGDIPALLSLGSPASWMSGLLRSPSIGWRPFLWPAHRLEGPGSQGQAHNDWSFWVRIGYQHALATSILEGGSG